MAWGRHWLRTWRGPGAAARLIWSPDWQDWTVGGYIGAGAAAFSHARAGWPFIRIFIGPVDLTVKLG
jgi:hypothetical protein